MKIIVNKEHSIEASELQEDGIYDYYYSYYVYTFEAEGRRLIARQYDDELTIASFLNHCQRRKRPGGWCSPRQFEEIPYSDPLFKKAAQYLLKQEGIKRIDILLCEGYVPADLTRLA
jgi:hypothetical protein